MHKITIIAPGCDPSTIDLDSFGKRQVTLGRGPYHGEGSQRNDIQIKSDLSFISRRQCSFYFDGGRWIIVDDAGVNGMVIHNEVVLKHPLHDGDKIQIGNATNCLILLFSSQNLINNQDCQVFSLNFFGEFCIGRQENSNIVIAHPAISRRHCIITYENGIHYIEDNHSANGVLVNGVPITRKTALKQMDIINIVHWSFIYCNACLCYREQLGGVGVYAERLTKVVGRGQHKKVIANQVSFSIAPNEFVAIIGGSGAGKTTIMNCLAGISGFTGGQVYINGDPIRNSGKNFRKSIGYVPQRDIVYDNLSLERMLFHSAKLRMPPDTSVNEIYKKIDETLRLVELQDHRKTLISKLSGGQKKRASIAVELLASPKLFFLDEPSSGLDPGTEKHLVQMLKNLSTTGKTVVMVTHTVQNIDLCDRIICIGKGGLLCFNGTPQEARRFFGVNDVIDIYDALNDYSVEVATQYAAYSNKDCTVSIPTRIPQQYKERNKGILTHIRQFGVMTVRYMEIMKNSLPRLGLLLGMPLLLAVLVCFAFQADGSLYNLFGQVIERKTFPFLVATDTMSIIFAFACAAFWVGIFNSVQEISKERDIFERERFTGISLAPYILSKVSVMTVLCLIQSLLMCGVFGILTTTVATVDGNVNSTTAMALSMGKNGVVFQNGGLWFELFLTTFLTVLSAMCLGLFVSALVSNDMGLVLCPVCLLPQILFSGVIGHLTGLTKAFSWIVTCRWSCIGFFTSVNVNELYGSCDYKEIDGWVTEKIDTPSGIIDVAYNSDNTYIFGLDPVKSAWLMLGIFCILFIIASALALKARERRMR